MKVKSQLLDAQLEARSTDPTKRGEIVQQTTKGVPVTHDGSQVQNIAVGSATTSTDNIIPKFDGVNHKLQGTGLSLDDSNNLTGLNKLTMGERLQFKNYTTTERDALGSPAAGETIFNTTTASVEIYDGSGWVKVGSSTGIGSTSIETDPFFQTGTNGFTGYDDASAAVDLDGGTASNLTITSSDSGTEILPSPYAGRLKIDKAAADASHEGVVKTYTIGNLFQDAGRLDVKMNLGSDTGFSLGDFEIQAYDVTNSNLIASITGLSDFQIPAVAAGKTKQIAFSIPIATTTASLRIAIHTATSSTSAIDMFISGIEVGLSREFTKPVVNTISYDSTSLKLWNVISDAEMAHSYTMSAQGQRVGEWLYVTGKVTSNANSSVTEEVQLKLDGLTVSTDHVDEAVVGQAIHSTDEYAAIRYDSTTGYLGFFDDSSLSVIDANDLDSGETLGFEFRVKIADWENSDDVVFYGQNQFLGSLTTTGSLTGNVTYTGNYWRQAHFLVGHARIDMSGGPTPTGTAITITLPDSLEIASAQRVANTPIGDCTFDISSTAYEGKVLYNSATSVLLAYQNVTGSVLRLSSSDNNEPATMGSGDRINVFFRVPIEGWS